MVGELLVLFSTIMNVLLLKFTGAVTGFQLKRSKLWLGAFCSALVATVIHVPLLSIIVSFLCLVGIAFSWRLSTFIVQGSWLMVGTLLVGGFLTMLQPLLQRQTSMLVLFIFLASCLLFAVSKGWQQKLLTTIQQEYVTPCELVMGEMQLSVRAYIDTGNECTEPLSQKPIHFINFNEVEDRLPATFCQALRRWQPDEPTNLTMFPESFWPRARFVQVATIQNKSQLVLAFRTDYLQIDERNYAEHYVVFTQNEAPFPQQAEMILHVCILLTK